MRNYSKSGDLESQLREFKKHSSHVPIRCHHQLPLITYFPPSLIRMILRPFQSFISILFGGGRYFCPSSLLLFQQLAIAEQLSTNSSLIATSSCFIFSIDDVWLLSLLVCCNVYEEEEWEPRAETASNTTTRQPACIHSLVLSDRWPPLSLDQGEEEEVVENNCNFPSRMDGWRNGRMARSNSIGRLLLLACWRQTNRSTAHYDFCADLKTSLQG